MKHFQTKFILSRVSLCSLCVCSETSDADTPELLNASEVALRKNLRFGPESPGFEKGHSYSYLLSVLLPFCGSFFSISLL